MLKNMSYNYKTDGGTSQKLEGRNCLSMRLGDELAVSGPDALEKILVEVEGLPSSQDKTGIQLMRALIERVTANTRSFTEIFIRFPDLGSEENFLQSWLLQMGIAHSVERASKDYLDLKISPSQFWQQPEPWLHGELAGKPYPQRFQVTNGRRHPLRKPKPVGLVYQRWIPWLKGRLSLHVVDLEKDLATFHRWMNDPRVDEFFEESGTLADHKAMLEDRLADPHVLPLFAVFEGQPFGYFEVYWAKENRLGPFYDADDFDRGWHVAIGEESCRGKAWITAWLPSLMHFMFLDDPRTMRIVGEPKASHLQQIRNLDRAGFSKVKHFDFPHKRALLVMLLRERFFEDSLWGPEIPFADEVWPSA